LCISLWLMACGTFKAEKDAAKDTAQQCEHGAVFAEVVALDHIGSSGSHERGKTFNRSFAALSGGHAASRSYAYAIKIIANYLYFSPANAMFSSFGTVNRHHVM
jgi:hypothetical protein